MFFDHILYIIINTPLAAIYLTSLKIVICLTHFSVPFSFFFITYYYMYLSPFPSHFSKFLIISSTVRNHLFLCCSGLILFSGTAFILRLTGKQIFTLGTLQLLYRVSSGVGQLLLWCEHTMTGFGTFCRYP